MGIPQAPQEAGGREILFMQLQDSEISDVIAALFKAYNGEISTDDGSGGYVYQGDLGVYSRAGLFDHGQADATNTTAYSLTLPVKVNGVLVKAKVTNVNPCWIGKNSAVTSSTGFRLDPGDAVQIPTHDGSVYVKFDTYTSGDGVEWIAQQDEDEVSTV